MSLVPPIRVVTRLLAEMQTAILSQGMPIVGGDLDRFAILSLIARHSGQIGSRVAGGGQRISVMSLAQSLSKPYETVRRHVDRLVQLGLCLREPGGIGLPTDAPPALARTASHAHDALVHFVDGLRTLGIALPKRRADAAYLWGSGAAAAVDVMLSVVDNNRTVHRSWLELAIFSAVLHANTAGFARDPAVALDLADERTPTPPSLLRAVRPAALARLVGIPDTSVRRHVAAMVAARRLVRTPRGLIASEAWLNEPEHVAVSRLTLGHVNRVLTRLAAEGFPFDDPPSAYRDTWPRDIDTGRLAAR